MTRIKFLCQLLLIFLHTRLISTKNDLDNYYDCVKLNQSISIEPDFNYYFLKHRMLKFENFNSFKDIKVNCSETLENIFLLEFIPNKKLILDNTLEKNVLDIEFLTRVVMYFSNLQGIDLNTLPDFGFLTQLNLKKDRLLQFDY
jgi:hypothetical protein